MTDINMNNPYATVREDAFIRQRVKLRMLTWLGSYLFDPSQGIPYAGRDVDMVAESLLIAINDVPGVTSVSAETSGQTIDLEILIDAPTNTEEPVELEFPNLQFRLTYEEYNHAI